MVAGWVTCGPDTLAVTKMLSAPALNVQAAKKAPAHSSRNITSGYAKTGRRRRLGPDLDARFLVFERNIFYFYTDT